MRKIVLLVAELGLVTLPIASLMACGSVWGDEKEDEKNHDRDGDGKKIVTELKDSYKTTLTNTETLDFEIGRRYKADSLGISDAFNDEFEFEIKDYDDLEGTLVVSVEQIKDSVPNVLRTAVKIGGFKTIGDQKFLERIIQDLPDERILSSDLPEKQKPSNLRTIEFLDAKTLGIEKYFRFRKADHFIEAVGHNDAVGELAVNLEIKIGAASLKESLTITNLDMDDPVLKERLDQINRAMREVKDAETSHSDVLPSRVMQGIGNADFWDQLGVGKFPTLDQEIKVTFERGNQTSDEKGQIELIVKFETSSGKNSLTRTKAILISGFLTTEGTKYDLSHVRAQAIKNFLEYEFDKITAYSKKLPTKVKKEFLLGKRRDLPALGLDRLPEKYQSGISALNLGTANDEKGTLVLIITIKVGKAQLESTLLIQGYATEDQIQEQARQKTDQELKQLLTHIRENHNRTILNQKLPSQIGQPQEIVDFAKLGLGELEHSIQSGTDVELKITFPNDHAGEIELEVTVSKNDRKLKDLLIVTGYKTTDQVVKENEAKVAKQLESLLDWISKNLHSTSNSNIRPSRIGPEKAPVTLHRLGLPNVPEKQRSGALLTFEVVHRNDFEGTLEVKVTAFKEGQQATKTYLISGYKTHRQEIEELLVWAKSNLKLTRLTGKLPSEIGGNHDIVNFEDLGLSKLPEELFGDYETELMIVDPDDNNGTLEVELTIRVDSKKEGNEKLKTNWRIKGYKSTNAVRDDLVAKMNWIEKNLGLTSHKDRMPSSIGWKEQEVDFKTLGIRELAEISDQGLEIRMVLIDWNDVKGEVEIKVTLSHRGVTHEDEFIIRGFKKIDDQLKQIMDLIRNGDLQTTKRAKLPSLIGQEDQRVTFDDLGLNDLTREQKQGAEIILKIVFPNDQKGTIRVKVQIIKSSQSKEFDVTVFGFKTLGDQVKEIKQQVKNLSEWIDQNWSTTSLSDKLPSSVGAVHQEIDSSSLGLKELPGEFKANFNLVMIIDDINQERGEIRVKASITRGEFREEKVFVIKGYKTAGAVRAQLESVFDWINQNWTSTIHSQSMPSSLGQLGREISRQKIGLVNWPEFFSRDTTFKLILWQVDDKFGTVVIRVTLNREGVGATRDFTVGGFKNVSDQLQEVLALIKQRLEKIKIADKMAGELGQKDSYITLSLLGLAELNDAERQDSLVKILVENVDDQNGRLSIVLEISKDGVVKKESLVLKGFLKISDVDKQKVSEVVRLIRDLNGGSSSDDQIVVKFDDKARFWDVDLNHITIDLIKNNASDWKIVLPRIPSDIELDWELVSVENSPKSVKVKLHLKRGSEKQTVTFVLEGFKSAVEKLIDSKLENLPIRLRSELARKLVSEFETNRLYTFAMLGVDISEFEIEPLIFEAFITGLKDRQGMIEVRAIISSSKSDYSRSKNIIVEGFWSDAKREKARQDLPAQVDKVFEEFHYSGRISGLSHLEIQGLKAYDRTTLSDLFIGDDMNYAPGVTLSLDDLRLSQKSAGLLALIRHLDPDYGISFEIAERPEGADFHGSIRIRPILHFIDQKIPGLQTFVISGFKSFETFFQEHVLRWSKEIGNDLRTASQGLKISLLNAVQNAADPLKTFMELSGLRDLFKDHAINDKYRLSIVDISFSKWYLDFAKPEDHSAEHSFTFLVGLKGQQYQRFNQELEHRHKLDYQYLQGRTFEKVIGGFKTGQEVSKTVSQLLARLNHTLNWRQRSDLVLDTSHLRGALSEMYGEHRLPEFDWNSYHTHEPNRTFLSEFGKKRVNPQSGEVEDYTVSFDYENKSDVARWLKLHTVNKHNKFLPWNKVPFDQDQLWNFDPSIRTLLGNALLWFQFTGIERVDVQGTEVAKELMNFKVGIQMVPNSPGASTPLVSPYQNQPISSVMFPSSLNVLEQEVKVELPNDFASYLRKSVDDQEHIQKSLINQLPSGKSKVKLLSSDETHKLEVLFGKGAFPRQIDEYWRRFCLRTWQFVYDSDVPNQRETKLGNTLSNILGFNGYGRMGSDDLKRFNFIQHLKGMGVMLFFEIVSHSSWNGSPGVGQYNANVKFRPVLVYNKALTSSHSELVPKFGYKPVRNKLTKPLVVTGKVWEIFYKMV